MDIRNIKTPYWGYKADEHSCPRDTFSIIGNTILTSMAMSILNH